RRIGRNADDLHTILELHARTDRVAPEPIPPHELLVDDRDITPGDIAELQAFEDRNADGSEERLADDVEACGDPLLRSRLLERERRIERVPAKQRNERRRDIDDARLRGERLLDP